MKFEIEIDVMDVLNTLQSLRREYLNKKMYFEDYPSEVEGLTTPQELAETHNKILEQLHNYGYLKSITPIKLNNLN